MPLLIPGDSVCLGMEWFLPEYGCFPHRDLKCSFKTCWPVTVTELLKRLWGHGGPVPLTTGRCSTDCRRGQGNTQTALPWPFSCCIPCIPIQPNNHEAFPALACLSLEHFYSVSLHGHQCHQTLQAMWSSLSFTISGTVFCSLASIQAQQRHCLIVS